MSEDRHTTTRKANAATVLAAVSFVLGTVGAVAFAAIFTVGQDLGGDFTQALGIALALALGGLGAGLVFWSRLMPQGPVVEERGSSGPDPAARRRMLDTLEESTDRIGRRSLLGRLLALAAGATGIAALFPLRSLGESPFPERVRTGWRAGLRLVTETGQPVAVDEMQFNSILTVFPEGFIREADTQTVLLRVPPEILRPPPGRVDWSPEGYVAFSKVCTHAGCPVGLYQVETQRLFCPCHQSAFDVLEAAAPIFGPATRSLPQLPLGVDDAGFLIARGDFDKPIGPGFWTYPGARDAQDREARG